MLTEGFARLNKGTIVSPEWPPITGIVVAAGFFAPTISATKVSARTTSRVVTPKSFFGLKTPASLSTSAAMGTVLLTGLEMTRMYAEGQCSTQPLIRSRTMPALILKRSSRVMPGLPWNL